MIKKTLLAITFMCLSYTGFSQVFVEDVDINKENIDYIELVGVNTSLFGTKIKVYVDYGQPVKFMKADGIKDANGETIKFNSMMHALNFFKSNGWNFVNYSEALIGSKVKQTYLLKKS